MKLLTGVFDSPDSQALIKREVFQHADWLEKDEGHLEETDANQRFLRRTGVPLAKLEELLQRTKEALTSIPESVALLNELAAQGFHLY